MNQKVNQFFHTQGVYMWNKTGRGVYDNHSANGDNTLHQISITFKWSHIYMV